MQNYMNLNFVLLRFLLHAHEQVRVHLERKRRRFFSLIFVAAAVTVM